jgi:hypothetical protein
LLLLFVGLGGGLALLFVGLPALAAPAYRASVAFTVDTAASKNLFWDTAPVVRLHLENKGAEAAPPLRYELRAQEIYFDREAWSVRDAFRDIPPGAKIDREEALTVPYGVYRVKWLLADAEGEFQSGFLDVARMMPMCRSGVSEPVQAYDRRWSLFGGAVPSGIPDDPNSAAASLADAFELGDEDNGSTMMLYTEAARHGAAGIRTVQPQAIIANSGTAFAGLGWLETQANRGLFDVLDVLCTRPFLEKNAPETIDILDQLGQVDDLIDCLGGMKFQWTAEREQHGDLSPQRLAEWIPRRFLISAAAGIERHTFCGREADPGFVESAPQPATVSVHALAKMLEGHRFVGLVNRDNDLWVAVFERALQPLAVAWSPSGNALWSVSVRDGFSVNDLFGNPLPLQPVGTKITVHVTGAPVYVRGVSDEVLMEAERNQSAREYERFLKCVRAMPVHYGAAAGEGEAPAEPWAALVSRADATANELRKALASWNPAGTPIPLSEQAVVVQALRWYWAAGRFGDQTATPTSEQERTALQRALSNYLAESVATDVDVPSLRYLLNRWQRLADEEGIARDRESEVLARRLCAMEETVAHLAEVFAKHGETTALRIGCPPNE